VTKTQIQLVRESFAKIEPMAVEAGILFYKRLFSKYPEFQPMFTGSTEQHGRELMNVISMAVAKLDDLDQIEDVVAEKGAVHSSAPQYVGQQAQYGILATVLQATLSEALGHAFTADVRAAWTEMYLMLVGVTVPARRNARQQPVAA